MDIIIAGAGKVGFNLASVLSQSHSVTVIDKNKEALNRLQESLDILAIEGDIENPKTYSKLINREFELFIAVTNEDEANLLSSMVSDEFIFVKRKFIRLKKSFFKDSQILSKASIDKTIFPIELTADSVVSLLNYPLANNIKKFVYTDFKLISVRINRDFGEFNILFDNFTIVGVERDNRFFIFSQEKNSLKKGDLIYLFGDENKIREICKTLESSIPQKIQKCVIFGANELALAIAKKLIDAQKEVKIVEKDIELCKMADEELGGEVMTLNSKYGSRVLFEEEGLKYADMVIASTNDDEFNIIKSLEAKEYGIKKTVAINNEKEYYSLMHSLGLVVVRGPKMSAYHTIIEQIHSSKVVTERGFCGGKGVVFLRKVFSSSHLKNKRVKPLTGDEIASFLIKKEKLLEFNEPKTLEEDDVLVVFGNSNSSLKIESWINGL